MFKVEPHEVMRRELTIHELTFRLDHNCNLGFFRALVEATNDLPDNARVSFDSLCGVESPFYKGEMYVNGAVTVRSAEVMSDERINDLPGLPEKKVKSK